jgi:hypothetical protein
MLLVSLINFCCFLILNYRIRSWTNEVLFFFQYLRRCLGCLRKRIRFYRIFFGHFRRNCGFFEWWRFIKFCYTLFTCDWIWLGPIGTGASFLWSFFGGLRRSSSGRCTFTFRFTSLEFLSTSYHCRCQILVFLRHLFHELLGLTNSCFDSIIDPNRKVVLWVFDQLIGGRYDLRLEYLPLFIEFRYQGCLLVLVCRRIYFLISCETVRGVIWGT